MGRSVLGYPEDTNRDEEHEDLIQSPNQKKQRRGSVADLAAKFEQTSKSESLPKKEESAIVSHVLPCTPPSYTKKAYSVAILLLGLATGLCSWDDSDEDTASPEETPKKAHTRVISCSQHLADERCCIVCNKKIFPTDDTTTCRNNTYHVGCFRCTLCSSKLKNHPDEEHKLVGGEGTKQHMLLQCRQCTIDIRHKNRPRRKSRVAGEKITVDDSEQGDIDQVIDAIGDDLEEAMWGMIPR